jgi:type IV secretion system protein TrbL
LPEVILLCLGGIIVIAAFFVLSIQLFVLIVEFKITTLAGFVLVPFAFWKQTTFLAERVLGNVISSGIKVLVIAVVIGIGSTMFATLRTALSPDDMTIEQAFAVVLGALTLMGLAIFCPRIAAGLVSGAPQLSAGAAAGTASASARRHGGANGRACGRWRDSWRHARGSQRLSVRCRRPSRGNRAGRHAHRPLRSHRCAAQCCRRTWRLGCWRSLARQQAASPVTSGAWNGRPARCCWRGRRDHATAPRQHRPHLHHPPHLASPPGRAGSSALRRSVRAWLVAAHTLNAGDGGGASEGPNLKQRD